MQIVLVANLATFNVFQTIIEMGLDMNKEGICKCGNKLCAADTAIAAHVARVGEELLTVVKGAIELEMTFNTDGRETPV